MRAFKVACETLTWDARVCPIVKFRGDHFFLSNFFKHIIYYDRQAWPSGEALFQSRKDLSRADEFLRLDPLDAKHHGKEVTLRPDWESVKDDIMLNVTRAKYHSDSDIAQLLLSTGRAQLIEGNRHGDTHFGMCGNFGENVLGKCLMIVREELREELQSGLLI